MQTAPDTTQAVQRQRRYAAVLFADLCDSSRLAEDLEEEDLSDLLDAWRRAAREVVARHGGVIARQQGDGLLAVFGADETREDEGRRAVEAALELHAGLHAMRSGPWPRAKSLDMHSGIHGGMLLITEGDIERGRLDLVGPVVNTAARLCSLAGAGQLLVSAETLARRQRRLFHITDLGQTEIRGRSFGPLRLLRIDGKLPPEAQDDPARRDKMPLLGRAGALGQLLAAARKAQGGAGEVALVVGEPGVGKSRLLDEFLARLDPGSFRVLQGYCESYLGSEPLQPFLQWMRRDLARRDAAAAANEAGKALTPEVEAMLQDAGRRQAPSPTSLIAAILKAVGMMARDRTIVMVLDDWQWADDASRIALESLLAPQREGEPPLPLLVVLASRPLPEEEHPACATTRLHLQPLDEEETAEAIASRLPLAHPFTVQEIYRQSGGTPLYIEELCHAVQLGDFHTDQRRPGVAWINTLVASRVERLPRAQAEVLRAASVAGHTFPDWLLAGIAGPDALAAADPLAAADFIERASQPGLLRFKHLLTREAVYATLTPAWRRALHLRTAQALEQSVAADQPFEWLESLAYHYDAAGVRDKAARYAEAAGDKALAASSLDRARAQYMTALRAMDAEPLEGAAQQERFCKVAQKLGQACVFDPLDLREGYVLFERALEIARAWGDTNAIARAEYWLAYMNYARGRPRESVRYGDAALEHAHASGDEKLARQLLATLGQALASAGRYDRALPMMQRALENKPRPDARRGMAAIGPAYTLARLGYTLADLGRFGESDEAFAEALALLGDGVHTVVASVLEVKCVAHLWQGRWDDAQAAALHGADVALRCRSRWMVAMGRALGACARWGATEDRAAYEMLRETTQWIEDRGGAVSTSLNYGWLVEASVARERQADARRFAARVFQRARAQDRHGEAIGCRALARLAAQHGDLRQAEHYLALADRSAGVRGSPRERAMNTLERARIAAIGGARTEARGRAEEAAAAFEGMGMAWHLKRAREMLQAV